MATSLLPHLLTKLTLCSGGQGGAFRPLLSFHTSWMPTVLGDKYPRGLSLAQLGSCVAPCVQKVCASWSLGHWWAWRALAKPNGICSLIGERSSYDTSMFLEVGASHVLQAETTICFRCQPDCMCSKLLFDGEHRGYDKVKAMAVVFSREGWISTWQAFSLLPSELELVLALGFVGASLECSSL